MYGPWLPIHSPTEPRYRTSRFQPQPPHPWPPAPHPHATESRSAVPERSTELDDGDDQVLEEEEDKLWNEAERIRGDVFELRGRIVAVRALADNKGIQRTAGAEYDLIEAKFELRGEEQLGDMARRSVRPCPRGLVVNIDVATGVMYARMNLIDFAMQYIGTQNARDLTRIRPNVFSLLKSVLLKVTVQCKPAGNKQVIKSIIADTVVPFELCWIAPGQLYRKRLNPDQTTRVLGFSTKRPEQRMTVSHTPMTIDARILDSPTIMWEVRRASDSLEQTSVHV